MNRPDATPDNGFEDVSFGFLGDLCAVNGWRLGLRRFPGDRAAIEVDDGVSRLVDVKFRMATADLDVMAEVAFEALFDLGRV